MRGYLGNTAIKLKKQKKLSIGYLGGSITEGYAASDPSKTSYRALTTENFRLAYPDADIVEIMASIGGTGSDLGVFRCEIDLLRYKPDLIFVEFAINDYNTDETRIIRSMEGIVRKVWEADASTDIVFIYTTSEENEWTYDQRVLFKSAAIHERIAEHFGIPSIDLGMPLWTKIKNENRQWKEFAVDGCHPNDTGFKEYANTLWDFLHINLIEDENIQKHILPEIIDVNNYVEAKMLDSWDINAVGWEKTANSLCDRYPHMLTSCKIGAEFKFKFQGTCIGIYWMVAPDSGDIEWRIDGKEFTTTSSWDMFANYFTRAFYSILAEDLENCEHELEIKVSENKQEESKGNCIRIGAFLVC